MSGSDPEAVGPFSDLFVTDISLICYNMVRCMDVPESSQETL